VQDDDEDKYFEIIQMPLIYSQTIVTIAAGNASAAAIGFLSPRREFVDGEAFDLTFQTDNGRTGTVTTVWKLTLHYGHEPLLVGGRSRRDYSQRESWSTHRGNFDSSVLLPKDLITLMAGPCTPRGTRAMKLSPRPL
jgi:hypothetical protein